MKQIKNGTRQPQFDILVSVMVDILILFHSTVDCEKIISFVIKTKIAYRHSISTKTLISLTVLQVSLNAKGTTCSQQKHSNTFLAKAKGPATYQKLMKKVTLHTMQC